MDNKKISRRDFLKLGGLAAVSLPAINKVGKIGGQDLFESPDVYGGFLVKQLSDGDDPFEMNGGFKRMHAKDVIFSRLPYTLLLVGVARFTTLLLFTSTSAEMAASLLRSMAALAFISAFTIDPFSILSESILPLTKVYSVSKFEFTWEEDAVDPLEKV